MLAQSKGIVYTLNRDLFFKIVVFAFLFRLFIIALTTLILLNCYDQDNQQLELWDAYTLGVQCKF